jgi:hypothetical protein
MAGMPTDAVDVFPVPSRVNLLAHLTSTRIVGEVATRRENNRSHYQALADGDRYYWLGLELSDRWTDEEAVLAVMARRCGVVPDPEHISGQDTIGAELCVDALDRMAVLLRKAVVGKDRVLFATGHPGGLYPVHRAMADAMARAGCAVVTTDDVLVMDSTQHVRFVDQVAVLSQNGHLLHTHSPDPMQALLDRLEKDAGTDMPDLVVADHGWAGHAAQRGMATVGFADCNDPALFLGEEEGTLLVAVGLDDNVTPHYYRPLTAYLLHAAGLNG